MKYLILFVLACFFFPGLNAQDLYNPMAVRGAVADSSTGKPVPFAIVLVLKGKKILNKTLTDSSGRFEIHDLPAGTYRTRISLVGYHTSETKSWTIDSTKTGLNLGLIKMLSEAINLKGVVVRGKKPLIAQRIDGITFNADRLPAIAGSDATDVLRNVPMIAVDPAGGLSIRGSSNVKILIDGKPSELYAPTAADALKMIRGENIAKVEVITDPSAKYDAEGTDAVVNIITRKITVNITNGNISGILGNRAKALMGEIHSKRGKWLINADAFNQWYWNQNGSVLKREAGAQQIVQRNETRQSGRYFFGGTNILYSLDSLNTLNIGYRTRPVSDNTDGRTDNFEGDNGPLSPTFQTNTRVFNDNRGNNINAGYTGTSKDRQEELSLLTNYTIADNTNGYNLYQLKDSAAAYRENLTTDATVHDLLVQADYSHNFNNKWKWEAGAKLTERHLKSVSLVDVYDPQTGGFMQDGSRADNFSYRSNIYAVYNNLSLKLKNWGFSGGLRYEHTGLGAVFKSLPLQVPSFGNLVPQVLVSRAINEKNTLKLGYSMKIVRPGIAALNPTMNRSDSLNISSGNPYLKPEHVNRFLLSYTVNNPALFQDFALFFNNNTNTIENIHTALPGGVFENTWANTGKNRRLGIEATANWKASPVFNFGATFTGQYIWLSSPALGIIHNGHTQQINFNSTYKLPKGFSIYFYGYFSSPGLTLQGKREGWKYYSMTISKKSADSRLNISLKLDAFLTRYAYIDEEITTGTYHQLQTLRYQNQNIRLNFSYTLGKREIKAPRIRQVENSD